MRQLFFIFLSCLLCLSSIAQGLKVGIYHKEPITRVAFSPITSAYKVNVDDIVVGTIDTGSIAYLQIIGSHISLSQAGKVIATGNRLALYSNEVDAECRLKPTIPQLSERIYPDVIIATAKRGKIELVNELEYPDYVAGVVEAEAGKGQDIEYYKTQSILCRTYAISNSHKHVNEGFHLCDKVHCQVFHGVARHDPIIPLAVEATKDLIAVDHDIEPITALFHSNCGGHTVNAEDVWLTSLPYCQAKRDTFCLAMPHSNWERIVSKSDWLSYLERYHQLSTDRLDQMDASSHHPPSKETRFTDGNLSIPLVQIRKDWNLRSTFFAITEEGDSITFTGQGFGHGVGMCQEGAMNMAKLGYAYDQILHFYFTDVHIVNQAQLVFYKDDE